MTASPSTRRSGIALVARVVVEIVMDCTPRHESDFGLRGNSKLIQHHFLFARQCPPDMSDKLTRIALVNPDRYVVDSERYSDSVEQVMTSLTRLLLLFFFRTFHADVNQRSKLLFPPHRMPISTDILMA